MKQLDLFAESTSEPDFSAERAIADRVPRHVRFGTSSWTFPGWSGLCYPPKTSEKALIERGLSLYTRYPLFGTVGIDRSCYGPISAEELGRYAEQMPPGFPAVMKVWNAITTRADARTGEVIDTYLDAAVFETEVLAPVRAAFGDHVGSLVFEFPPFRGRARPTADAFAESLDKFFAKLPKDVPYSVELRNRELLTKSYLQVLARHGVGHVLNLWEQMPDIGDQLAIPGILPADRVVCRLLMRPGTKYADRKEKMAPFDRIVDRNEEMREDVAALADLCDAVDKSLFVLVNNKAEGCSPLTVRALALRVAGEPVMDAPPRPC